MGARMTNPGSRTLIHTAIVALGYFLSRVLGLVRDMVITAQFGTSPHVDAYRAAFALPDLLYLVVAGGALGTALIPVFQARRVEAGESAAWDLANAVLNLALPVLVGCAVVGWIFAEPIVRLTTAQGFEPQQQALTAHLMRLLLLQPILLGIGGIAKATLEAHEQFRIPTIGSNLYNVGIIIGAAALAPWYGIDGVVYGVLIGAIAFVAIQIPTLRSLGWHYQLRGWATQGVRAVGALVLPRLFGQSIWQINLTTMIAVTSAFGLGAVAASGYALQIMLLPHGLIGLSIGTVIFPLLANHLARGDRPAFARAASLAVQSVLAVTIPASVVLYAGAGTIVKLLYERGSFDGASAALTTAALEGYAIGLAGFCVAEIAVRIWFALQNTRLPVIVGLVVVLFNVTFGWLLSQNGSSADRLWTIASVFSVANIIEATLLLWYLRRAHPDIQVVASRRLWLLSIGGMVLLLTTTQPFLPPLPDGPLQTTADWGACLLHLVVLGAAFAWGVTWGSDRFALLSATRRGHVT
ncbi:MAG: murein biosynthesis integral membrane protein MurJ [Chloroflexi bacterium]|nr:MAG: murein biosynthesis integral membrane protein MurJ [Chloroflexota bacterium]RLT34105.1 MAG: murein biosynthesis integral membrane protein MurJ [Chloroflexota bacterium]